MPERAALGIRIDASDLTKVARVLRQQGDGKQLRKDLVADLKTAVDPGVQAVRGKLLAMPAAVAPGSPPMGSYVASKVRSQVRLSGQRAGVAVRIPQTPQLRGFTFAARRLNATHWRHPVFRTGRWVTQRSPITGYFDETLAAGKPRYQAAVMEVLRKLAERLAARR